jgi:hypothetical protein
MSLEKTIKDLEALEESLKANGVDGLNEDQLKQLTDQLQGAFDLAQGEIGKLETESKIQLENLQNEE